MAKKVVTTKEFEIDGFYFKDYWDKDVAQFFIDKKSDFMFALSVDFPGLYEIDLAYLDRVKAELKAMGFKVFNSSRNTRDGVPHYRIFYLGPRVGDACSTRKDDARSFRIFIYSLGGK